MKKKLLSMLLVVMTVMALVPATVISAATSALWASTGLSESEAAFEVLDEKGQTVGYYATFNEADAVLDEGYTVKFLKDLTTSTTLKLGYGRLKAKEVPAGDVETLDETGKVISYTVDGNGKTIYFEASEGNGSAFVIDYQSEFDRIAVKDLTIVSSKKCVNVEVSSGGKAEVTFTDCKFYAGNMYFMVNPAYYGGVCPTFVGGDAVSNGYLGVTMELRGAKTEVLAYKGAAVACMGRIALYDGYYYSHGGVGAVWQGMSGSGVTSGLEFRNTFIYGGTYVADGRAVLCVELGTQMFVLGGTFIHTAGGSLLNSGWGTGFGHAYVYGGNFVSTGANGNLLNYTGNGAVTLTRGRFFYNEGAKIYVEDEAHTQFHIDGQTTTSHNPEAYAAEHTVRVLNESGLPSTLTVSTDRFHGWGFEYNFYDPSEGVPAVEYPMRSGAAAADNFDVAILDKEGNLVWGFSFNHDNGDNVAVTESRSVFVSSAATDHVERLGDAYSVLLFASLLIPENGTMKLTKDLHVKAATGYYDMFDGVCNNHVTIDGTIPEGLDVPARDIEVKLAPSNAYMLRLEAAGKYAYWLGGIVTLRNVVISNPTGRVLELNHGESSCYSEVRLENSVISSGAGSAAYLNFSSKLTLDATSALTMHEGQDGGGELLQIEAGATLVVNGGTLYHPKKASGTNSNIIKDIGGNTNELMARRRTLDASKGMKYACVQMFVPRVYLNGAAKVEGNSANKDYILCHSSLRLYVSPEATFTNNGAAVASPYIEGLLEVLNAGGQSVGVVNTFADALDLVKDGYTVKMLKDYTSPITVALGTVNQSFTLDGNGHKIGSATVDSVGRHYMIMVTPYAEDITFTNLTVENTIGGIHVYGTTAGSAAPHFPEMHLHNVKITAGSDCAYYQNKQESLNTKITGSETKMSTTTGTTLITQGSLQVYDGEFTTQSGERVLSVQHYNNDGLAGDNDNHTVGVIFGGTFKNGATSSYVAHANSGKIIMVGGQLINQNTAATAGVVQLGKPQNATPGWFVMLGGTIYNAGSGDTFIYNKNTDLYDSNNAATTAPTSGRAQALFLRGTIYQNSNAAIDTTTRGASTSTGMVRNLDVKAGFYVHPGVTLTAPAANNNGNGYSHVITATYTGTVDNAIEVYNPLMGENGTTLYFNSTEFDWAIDAVGDGGTLYVTKNISYTPYDFEVSAAYAGSRFMASSHLEWAITSKQDSAIEGTEVYAISRSATGKYFMFQHGTTLTLTNVIIKNTAGRGYEMQNSTTQGITGAAGVLNIGEKAIVAGYNETSLHVNARHGFVNLLAGGVVVSTAESVAKNGGWGGLVKMNGGTFTMAEGSFLGCKADGTLQNTMDAIQIQTANSRVIVNGGTIKTATENILQINNVDCYVYMANATLYGCTASAVTAAGFSNGEVKEGDTVKIAKDDNRYNRAVFALKNGRVTLEDIKMGSSQYLFAFLQGTSYMTLNGAKTDWTANRAWGDHFVELFNSSTGTLEINGGNFTCTSGHNVVLTRGGNSGNVYINGGRFENTSGGNIFVANGGAAVNHWYFNGGEFYKPAGSTSRMMKFYGDSVVEVNGGYYEHGGNNDIFCIDDNDSSNNGTNKTKLTINGGVFNQKANGATVMVTNACKKNSNDTNEPDISVTINGGTFNTTGEGYTFNQQSAYAKMEINGGVVTHINKINDSAVNIEAGSCTINGGLICSAAASVARTLGGKTSGTEGSGGVTTASTAVLNIKGGVLWLLPEIEGGDDNWAGVAVIRAGGSSNYGTVNISGGVFINQRKESLQVINMTNACAIVNMTGGTLLQMESTASYNFYSKKDYKGNDATAGAAAIPSSSIALSEKQGVTVLQGLNYQYYNVGGQLPAFISQNATQSGKAGEMIKGAQVRLISGSSGLRFITNFDAATVAALEALGTVEYGTVIAPTENVLQAGEFTLAALKAKGLAYADIVANNGLTPDGEGGYNVRAALVNIKKTNYDRAFSAIGYAKVIDANGIATYYYTAYTMTDNARSIKEVATAAINDVVDDATVAGDTVKYAGYVNQAYTFSGTTPTEKAGYKSRYTLTQLTALAAYLAS